jgi:hypothetical protein
MHHDIICSPAVTRELFNSHTILGPTSMVEVAYWWSICPSTAAYKCSQTPCICLKEMWEPFCIGLGPEPMQHDIVCSPAVTREFRLSPTTKILGPTSLVEVVYWLIQLPHQLHMNVLKHPLYVWIRSGNHSMWVWGLNQCTMTSFVALMCPKNYLNPKIFWAQQVRWRWHISWSICPSTAQQNMNVLKHLVCIEWIWGMWEPFCVGLGPQPMHHDIIFICLEWMRGMWEPFHVGLGPQPMHHDIICNQSLTQEFRLLPNT